MIHSEIYEIVNDFGELKIIGDISCDVSDYEKTITQRNQNSARMRYFRRLQTWGDSSRNMVT